MRRFIEGRDRDQSGSFLSDSMTRLRPNELREMDADHAAIGKLFRSDRPSHTVSIQKPTW
jgi:hypothetical protein